MLDAVKLFDQCSFYYCCFWYKFRPEAFYFKGQTTETTQTWPSSLHYCCFTFSFVSILVLIRIDTCEVHTIKLLNIRLRSSQSLCSGFVQVLEILESPGISGNHFPGLESPGILMQVLESPGNLNLATSFNKMNALKFLTR